MRVAVPDIVLGLLAVPVTETLDPAITAGPAGLTALDPVSAGAAGGSGIALYPYWAPAAEAGAVTASWTLDQADVLTAVLAGISATASPPVPDNENCPLVVVEAAFGAQPAAPAVCAAAGYDLTRRSGASTP